MKYRKKFGIFKDIETLWNRILSIAVELSYFNENSSLRIENILLEIEGYTVIKLEKESDSDYSRKCDIL
jgi:hypothetical protein